MKYNNPQFTTSSDKCYDCQMSTDTMNYNDSSYHLL